MKKVNRLVTGLLCMVTMAGFSACATLRTIFDLTVPTATLWVNGEPQTLSGPRSVAIDVYVFEGDFFVVGTAWDSYNEIYSATLWVNGVSQTLSTSTSRANSVRVYGDDVFVTGFEDGKAILWVNGVPQILSYDDSFASSVFVYDGDVFVTGTVGAAWGAWDRWHARATLWVNGEPQTLSNLPSQGFSVYVSSNNVYVVGEIFEENILRRRYYHGHGDIMRIGRATLWRNGVSGASERLEGTTITTAQALRGGGTTHGGLVGIEQQEPRTSAHSVFVSGSDVFVVGMDYLIIDGEIEHERVRFWVNSELQTLGAIRRSFTIAGRSRANSVFVSGGDVYVVGRVEYLVMMQQRGISRAMLWVNGDPQTLSDIQSNANSVFVSNGNVFVVGTTHK